MVHPWHLPLLFATGLVAGFVDSIAGGGGLITLPVLLNLGMDPKVALGTNKLQATFGSGSATVHFARAGTVALRECKRGFVFTFTGAALGTLLVQQLPRDFLGHAIPVLLILVAVYALLKPDLGAADAAPRLARGWFDAGFGLCLGFYDGFFGPGTGTFWAMAFVLGLGFNLTRATGFTKVMNFASNLSSLLFFLLGRNVLLVPGLAMGLGQLLGARMGSHLVVAKGTKFIRPVFIAMVLAITAKLLYDNYVKRS
ncbi:MAG TPA: TSUP family transporter [Verrucomicrobiae bacterium]|nr:TSUP family transporter [Verrucomicrobiae bacterium]